MNPILEGLQYVKNTNGGATRSHFIEDFEPVGERMWIRLHDAGFVRQDQNGRIHLTDAGTAKLSEPEQGSTP